MTDGGDADRTRRVIALLPATAAPPEAHPSVAFVCVHSGYEAAAEMLAAPASALVVDLGRVTPTHAPLLGLAHRLELPVVAFGAVSADLPVGQVQELRLVPREGVGQALREVLGIPEAAGEPAGKARPVEAPARSAPAGLQGRARMPTESLTQAELDALLRDGP